MGIIRALCVSEKRGTKKSCADRVTLKENWGIEGDAHADTWHRQVSLLSQEKIEAFRANGAVVEYGGFGENIVAEGIDFRTLPVGTRLSVGDVLMEISQIGKECHSHCAIYYQTGDCIMPREGIFAKVIHGGVISVGDELSVLPAIGNRRYQAAIVTLSDKGSRGEREDISGTVIEKRLQAAGFDIAERLLLPDERALLEKALIRLADSRQVDLVFTTGGTGFAPRDITPEATMAVADRNAPGIAEAMRAHSLKITPRAMLSRAVSVIRGRCLIINLPGSPKACTECLDCVMDTLPHALDLLRDTVRDCANT